MPRSQLFGPEHEWPAQDLIAFSDEFDAGLALAAYRAGVFPMPLHDTGFDGEMGWWSPQLRGVISIEDFVAHRSVRRSVRRYRLTCDTAFAEVLAGCADPRRPHGWIDEQIRAAYTELHQRGFVHSIEVWTSTGELAGGLYGVNVGGLFAGESMFHRPDIGRDASKVALVGLISILRAGQRRARLLDVQWVTEHLASLGAYEIGRAEYLRRLDEALDEPPPLWPRGAFHA